MTLLEQLKAKILDGSAMVHFVTEQFDEPGEAIASVTFKMDAPPVVVEPPPVIITPPPVEPPPVVVDPPPLPVNLIGATAGSTSMSLSVPFVAGKTYTLELEVFGPATGRFELFTRTAKGKTSVKKQGPGDLKHVFVATPVMVGLFFDVKGGVGWDYAELFEGGTVVVEPPPVVVEPPPVIITPPPVEPPPVAVEPPPVVVPTVSIARFGHASTVNEGERLVTRITIVNGQIGQGFDITLDNSPLSEADFANSLLADGASGLPNGIRVSLVGARTLRYMIMEAGGRTFDLDRELRLDVQTEGTEQVNFKLTNPVGGIVLGSSTVSDWAADTSLSPPYVPSAPTVTQSPLTAGIMRGVNHAGAEFATAVYPRTAEIDWCIKHPRPEPATGYQGFGLVRIPFKMSRALDNGSMLATKLNPTFVTEMNRVIKRYNDAGVVVLIDAHDYGRFGSTLAGDGNYTPANAKRWWRMIADQVCAGKKVMFDLQNEPHDQNADKSWSTQVASAEGIRESGHLGHCIFAHIGWAGISRALGDDGGIAKFLQYTGGIENRLLGFHSYPDKDSAGTVQDESLDIASGNANVWVDRWTAPVAAARAAGVGLFVGEFGCGVDANSLQAIANFRAFMDANQDVIRGYTWWATGPWKTDYIRAIGKGYNNAQVQHLV